MRPVALCLPLMFAVWMASAAFACAERFTPPSADEVVAEESIAALIRQLADPKTAKRDAAAKRLIEIGPAAKAQLKAACENETELEVIRRRARVLLMSIARRQQNANWEAFLEGKSAVVPPGWKKFQLVVGNSRKTRELFLSMYRKEPELLGAYESSSAKATALMERRCATMKPWTETSNSEAPISVASVATYLLLAGDKKVKISREHASRLFENTGLIFEFFQPDQCTQFVAALREESENSAPPVLRKLLGRFIGSAEFSGGTPELVLAMAAEYGLKEGLSLALKILHDKDNVSLNEKVAALYLVGRVGGAENVKQIEALLKDVRVYYKSSGDVDNRDFENRLCDVALVTLLQITGQQIKQYGVEHIDNKSWKRSTSFFSIVSSSPIFRNDDKRQHALAKWSAWRKEHPKLSTTDELSV